MSTNFFSGIEIGGVFLTESPRKFKKNPYEPDNEYQVYTVTATNNEQVILKGGDYTTCDYHTLWVGTSKDGNLVFKIRGNTDYNQDSIVEFPGVWYVSKRDAWARNIPDAITSYETLVWEVSQLYSGSKYTKKDNKCAQALYDLVQSISGEDIANGNPVKLEAIEAALEDFFISINDVIAHDNNRMMVARAKMIECYKSILELQTEFTLPSPEGETVTLKKYDSYPNRLVYSGTFKEGDIYVVPKGNNQPAPGDLMFRVTEIDGNTVWVKGNTPDMLLGNLFVGDTDSPNNLYYLTMGGKLPVALGDIMRLPVITFEDGEKYLAGVKEQVKLLKTLYGELGDIFSKGQSSCIYGTFRGALLEMRDSIECGSNSALVFLNNLIAETYKAPKQALMQAKRSGIEQLQNLATEALG